MAEFTTKVCDGRPSYVNERVDEFVHLVGRYCPSAAKLVELRDLRDVAQVCPAPTADARVLVNESHAYCMLYPSAYSVHRPNPEETVIVVGSLLNVQDARLSIEVRDAAGRTAEQAVEERLAEVAGFRVERSATTVGGIEAIVLGPMPGQELGLQVLFTQSGPIHGLTFTPADPEVGGGYSDMLELRDVVTGSWAFLPPAGRG